MDTQKIREDTKCQSKQQGARRNELPAASNSASNHFQTEEKRREPFRQLRSSQTLIASFRYITKSLKFVGATGGHSGPPQVMSLIRNYDDDMTGRRFDPPPTRHATSPSAKTACSVILLPPLTTTLTSRIAISLLLGMKTTPVASTFSTLLCRKPRRSIRYCEFQA